MQSGSTNETNADLTAAEEAALDTAADLREDLEVIAESDLPFAYDAKQILAELDNANLHQSNTDD